VKLRPYQESARLSIHEAWKEVDKVLLVLPTGCGKTIVFSHLAHDIVCEGGRVLIMAHRGELLEQAADKLMQATGLGCAIEKADEESHEALHMITVGSVQTLMRPARLARFAEDHFTHIIIDEAHHCLAASYQAATSYFNGAKILGVTATPDRADRKSLGQYFEKLAYEYTLIEAIRDKYLSPLKALSIPLKIDLSGVKMQSGDFAASDLGDALSPYLASIVHEMRQHCLDRKTLVFTPLVATAQKFAELLQAEGFNANWVSGDDPNRKEKLTAYAAAGKGAVLVNSMLLTEGYDDPATDCIVCLRPTKSRPLYAQIVGRGTRLYPGKTDLLLLDFLWMAEKHELCRPAHIVSESPEEAAVLTEMAEKAGAEGIELDDGTIASAQSEVVKKREDALAKKLAEQRNRRKKLVDPLQDMFSVQAADLSDYAPNFTWEMAPATEAQKIELEKSGIDAEEITNAGMASRLIDRLRARRTAGFASPKQIRLLERYGVKRVGQMPAAQATKYITRLAANSWRMPDDLMRKIKEHNT